VELLWEPLAVAALNQPIAHAAAEPFARVLAQMLGPDPRDAAVGIPLKPLDELYVAPAVAFLEARGATVRTNAQARVAIERDAVAHVAVRDEVLRAGGPRSSIAHRIPDPGPRIPVRSMPC
jgi:hypothetical protein